MAVELGAEDVSRRRAYLDKIYIYPLSPYSQTNAYINLKGYTLWVNSEGERFNNEFCGQHVPCYYSNAKLTQAETWAVFDSAFIDRFSVEATEPILRSCVRAPTETVSVRTALKRSLRQPGLTPIHSALLWTDIILSVQNNMTMILQKIRADYFPS